MLSASARALGSLSGRTILRIGLFWMRYRASKFDLDVEGSEHIEQLGDAPYLIVSNHVPAKVSVFGRLAHVRIARQFNHSLDSFIYDRVVFQATGRRLAVAATCDRGWWSPRPFFRMLQKQIGQPFAKAQMEAMGYVPVELNPGCFQRDFLHSVERAVRVGRPLLIFPESSVGADISTASTLKSGPAHLAMRLGLAVVPAYIEGTSSWNPPGRVAVRFGLPFKVSGMTKNEINKQIAGEVGRLMRERRGSDEEMRNGSVAPAKIPATKRSPKV